MGSKVWLVLGVLLLAGCKYHAYVGGPVAAPEIDPADALAALTLTAIIVTLIADRGRK